MPTNRRQFMAASAATGLTGTAAVAQTAGLSRLPAVRAPRLKPGDTVALVNPSNAIYERAPYVTTIEALQTLGFKVREAPHLRARYGATSPAPTRSAQAMSTPCLPTPRCTASWP